MKLTNISIFFSFILLITSSCRSKKEIYQESNVHSDTSSKEIDDSTYRQKIYYTNKTAKPNIKTVLCHQEKEDNSLAIINLDSDDKLLVSFDDLNSGIKDYYYTIIHCNADWTASNLMKNEYIKGFTEELITDYEFSFNTIQKYTHYYFKFPSNNIKPTISGNYIIKVYEEDGTIILYKRFMVIEKKLHIEANVRRATLAADRKSKHEIDFTIKHPSFIINHPFSDLKVHIKQNNREDNTITDLTPQYVRNDELIYDYEDDNTFFGNNEYRHFDFKSLRYHSERIEDITYDSTYNHVYLFEDKKRSFDRYSIDLDINGKFLIRSQEGREPSIEADYAFIHFTLPTEKINSGDVYLLGKFCDWEIKDDFRLKYNSIKQQYETAIYLKQGYYNYLYGVSNSYKQNIDVSLIEGTHYQTRNDYYIYVYYRSASDRYDRLIGFLKTSSKELF